MADLDEPPIWLLARLAPPVGKRRPLFEIAQADPGLGEGIYSVLSTLELHGIMIAELGAGPIGPPSQIYVVSGLGRTLPARLEADVG